VVVGAAGEAREDHIAEADIAAGDGDLARRRALIADADAVFRRKAADDQMPLRAPSTPSP
jgi:hypothetical protein